MILKILQLCSSYWRFLVSQNEKEILRCYECWDDCRNINGMITIPDISAIRNSLIHGVAGPGFYLWTYR